MEFSEGISFIRKAFEKENEQRLWDLYIAQFPYMDKETFISFEDYKKQLMAKPSAQINKPQSKEQILESVEAIINLTVKGGDPLGV
ncbi:hypothetical protein [Eubacterium sp. 1001713B170207_170306_E7]|uniref:hypothetical protein n=1 Tax=Eubacterium sp. 1001713B170207_170306_E7 TaxID=2787097 RepID=UPI0018971828|nr:hypothetical protein [Eubacterium sp. 1001713B170207_170306_E7]